MPKDTHTRAVASAEPSDLELPEQVNVRLAELAGAAKEGLLALAVGTGLQVLDAMLAEDVTTLCGLRAGGTLAGPPTATAARTAR